MASQTQLKKRGKTSKQFSVVALLLKAPFPENSGNFKTFRSSNGFLFSSSPAAHCVSSAVSLTQGDKPCYVRSQQHNATISRYSLSTFRAHLAIQRWRTYSAEALEAKSFCFLQRESFCAAARLVVFPHVWSGHSLQQALQANRLQGVGSNNSSYRYTRRSGQDAKTGEIFIYMLKKKTSFSEIATLGSVPQSRIKACFTSSRHIWIKG